MLWAIAELCERRGISLQNFLSRSCLALRHGGSAAATTARHLDSWLMTRDVCREIFAHGMRSCELAIVEGQFDAARAEEFRDGDGAGELSGGSLDQLCQWLDLPRVVVLDVAEIDACRLPERPAADALLLDRVAGESDFRGLQTRLESLWGIPVLGGLERLAEVRKAIPTLSPAEAPPRRLCRALGDSLERFVRFEKMLELATTRSGVAAEANRLLPGDHLAEMTIAVAYDEAFNCYFPDTLDLLELQGANVRTFSPLHDDTLPEADVVYLGCGHPEPAEVRARLAGNQCMRMLLQDHVFGGGRVYAEGGGLAYLCEAMALADGSLTPMAGLLPAVARLVSDDTAAHPVEITLSQGNWLGEGWSQLRGYLNSRWELEPTGELIRYAAQEGHELDLVGTRQVIGSRIHLNFAAQPEFLRAFFAPHPPAMKL